MKLHHLLIICVAVTQSVQHELLLQLLLGPWDNCDFHFIHRLIVKKLIDLRLYIAMLSGRSTVFQFNFSYLLHKRCPNLNTFLPVSVWQS